MRLKGIYWIFCILLLAVLSILAYVSIQTTPKLFYVVEGLIFLSFLLLLFFYRKVVKPLRTIGNGMNLLQEQDFSSRLSPVGEFEADRVVEVFNRMMEQLKNERLRLREQNQLLDLLINATPMGVIILGSDKRVASLNPSAEKILGKDVVGSIEGKKLEELDSMLAGELSAIPMNEVQTIRLNDSNIYRCSHLSFVDKGFRHPFFLIESLTDEVMKAEKKAYEKVIRMIAHEVNNTTAGITSTLDTAEQALTDMEQTEDIRDVMRVCIERCFSMSRFITNFANVVKIPEPQPAPVNLNELISSCKRFMETPCRNRNIAIHLDLCDTLDDTKVDASLFEQVLVNIIKNAAESIEQDGDIYITTTSNPACIEIADTGKGIGKEVETKLFSPFFSTKPNGQGIGLIFIREVLVKHGCTFSLRTYSDGLTRFRIMFK